MPKPVEEDVRVESLALENACVWFSIYSLAFHLIVDF